MLKDTEFAYAVARIRSNESKLLSSSQIESLINAADYGDALKILADAGFNGFGSLDEDEVLSNRLRDAFNLIYESAPDKNCLDFLIVKNDFHNIKAYLKAMVTGTDAQKMLLSPSIVDKNVLKRAIEEKEYSLLPEYLSGVCEKAYGLVTETMDGQVLEVYLDRACIETAVELAKISKDEFSVSLAQLMAALSNIRIAVRCLKTGKDAAFMENAFSDCLMIDKKRLIESVLSGTDALCGYVGVLGFANLSESIKQGYAAFEKVCDDILIEKIRHAKYECLGISPLIAYYFATDAEVKTVRIILSCKKNGFSSEIIRGRVRELYV